MYQYTPRYPKAFGHPAWSLYGFINDALLQDLFWRKVQTDPSLVISLAKLIDPYARRDSSDIFLSDNTAISLHLESCGAYSTQRNRLLNCLHGNSEDEKLISEAEEYPAASGLYLGPLFQQKKGWLPENICLNIIREIGLLITPEDRYLFNRKACHSSVLMTDKDKQNAHQAIKNFPIDFGFKRFRVYWYSTENGSTAFGVVYFFDESGRTFKLPISAWESVRKTYGNVVFDLLHPDSKSPLYDLFNLVQWRGRADYVLICANEVTCEAIKKNHAWIPQLLPVTTYSSLERSDWASLGSMTPIIFPDNTVNGCHEAFEVYSALQKQGGSPYFLRRQGVRNTVCFVQDLSDITRNNGDGKCDLSAFAQHCRREFGVEPPQGILPQGQPLLELPGGESEPEPLLEGLLSLGDQMTIFAWRGVGKSLFSLLLALCFANGHKALNGRVCPSHKYRTLLIDGEMRSDRLIERACSITKGLGLPKDAANNLIARSSVAEKKNLVLDTEEGWLDLLPDLEQADIIIVDGLFKVFPSCMSNEISSATALNSFYDWCRKHEKTAIMIDHQGKKGDTAFGTMGKEMTVDAVLQLKNGKHAIEATATKNRNFEFTDKSWIKYSIKNESDGMTFQPIGQVAIVSSTTALPAGEDEGMKNSDDNISAPNKPDTDQAIIEYITSHSDQSQGDIVKALMEQLPLGRSTLSERIKQLREAGKLNFWKKAPAAKGKREETSSVAVEPSKGDS